MSVDKSIVAVDLLLLRDSAGQDVSEKIVTAALVHLDSYIANTFVKATASCTSYFSLTSDGPGSVISDACKSMSVANVESKIITFDKTEELLQVTIKTSFTVEHQQSRSASVLADAFIFHQARKITKQGNFPLGIQVKCMACPSVRLHWYTFAIVRSSSTDLNSNEAVAPFENSTTAHLNSFVGNPKLPLASSNVLATDLFRKDLMQTMSVSSSCQVRGVLAAATEYHLNTLIVSTFPADLDQAVAKGLKYALHSNILANRLEPSLELSGHAIYKNMCALYAFPSQLNPARPEILPPTPAPAPPQPTSINTTSGMYKRMDVSYWTKVVIVIPFAMLFAFGVILINLHRRRVKNELHQVHPIKVEV